MTEILPSAAPGAEPSQPADPGTRDEPGELRPGRTAPLDPAEEERLFRRGVALFNGVRYWHAHEAWETLWRAAPEEERDFYQGLILVAAGLLHLQRRNLRGARNKLAEGGAKLTPYEPAHRGVFVNELVGRARLLLDDLNQGFLPYLIPPVIRFTDAGEADFSR
ncbi:MAG: DUF309 domain-containing protein [Chloroflexota bacterium]